MYWDLRAHPGVQREHGALVTDERPGGRDTDMVPLVRWPFRGLPEPRRRAFLFTRPVDGRGGRFGGPALIGCYAPSRRVYALGMRCEPDEIHGNWGQAQLHPVAPGRAERGPYQEQVHEGEGFLAHGGLFAFPVSMSMPRFGNPPCFTVGHWVTRDLGTGVHNIGTYRGMLRAADG